MDDFLGRVKRAGQIVHKGVWVDEFLLLQEILHLRWFERSEKGDHLLVKPDVLEEPPGAYYSRVDPQFYRDKEDPRLTESGFQFLLMDTNAQLWYIIREYISNSEIVSFLQQNAHPRVAERMPSVLENVMDQDAFEAACNFAREFSSLLCEDSKKMRLIVKTEIYGHMKDFLSHQK